MKFEIRSNLIWLIKFLIAGTSLEEIESGIDIDSNTLLKSSSEMI